MFIDIKGYQVEIDSDNYKWISETNFSPIKSDSGVYFKYKRNGKTLLLHRTIIGAKKGEYADHENGNTICYLRSNLRICNSCQNAQNAKLSRRNKLKLKGVYWHRRDQIYYAEITANHVKHRLGSSMDCNEMHELYCIAALKYHGNFARFE